MKKSIITSITAVMAAAVMSVSAFAESNAVVSTTTYLDGVVCGGDINITDIVNASGNNVVNSGTTVLNGVIAGGNINIADLNELTGTNVVDISQLGINNTISGGSMNINKIHDIAGTNIAYGDINQITGTAAAGSLNLNGILFTGENYEQLNAQTQNILGNDYFGGGINVNNIIQ